MRLSNNELRRALQALVNYLAYPENDQIARARKVVIEQFKLDDTEKLDAELAAEEAEWAAEEKAERGD